MLLKLQSCLPLMKRQRLQLLLKERIITRGVTERGSQQLLLLPRQAALHLIQL
jgi:hypothetical protein